MKLSKKHVKYILNLFEKEHGRLCNAIEFRLAEERDAESLWKRSEELERIKNRFLESINQPKEVGK